MNTSTAINLTRPKKMVSLFSGIGGFELAFADIGVKTTLMCEIDAIAQHVLKTNFPDVKLCGDICELEKLPKGTDVLCAGFPCQDISTIGCKKGLDGERSSLIKEVFRLLYKTPVEWVVIENVTNMLHLRNGEIIHTIVSELEKLGYNWAYRTINSMAFLPQHRCRVFVVASLHHNPNDVLLSGESKCKLGEIKMTNLDFPCGFYWTEGKYAIGLYQNAVPTLKCGSTIGIASPPAIVFPSGEISTPDIRDGERLQGFPIDWTKPAEDVAKTSSRWKLVGNAVTVDAVSWIANKVVSPIHYDDKSDIEFRKGQKWPPAAWGKAGKHYISSVSTFPINRDEQSLSDFLQFQGKALSLKAAKGFEHRLATGTVHCPQFFSQSIHNYVNSKEI